MTHKTFFTVRLLLLQINETTPKQEKKPHTTATPPSYFSPASSRPYMQKSDSSSHTQPRQRQRDRTDTRRANPGRFADSPRSGPDSLRSLSTYTHSYTPLYYRTTERASRAARETAVAAAREHGAAPAEWCGSIKERESERARREAQMKKRERERGESGRSDWRGKRGRPPAPSQWARLASIYRAYEITDFYALSLSLCVSLHCISIPLCLSLSLFPLSASLSLSRGRPYIHAAVVIYRHARETEISAAHHCHRWMFPRARAFFFFFFFFFHFNCRVSFFEKKMAWRIKNSREPVVVYSGEISRSFCASILFCRRARDTSMRSVCV